MNNFICSKSSKSSNENMTVSPNYCNILIIIILSYMLTHSHFMLEVCIIGIISEEVNSTSMSPYLSERLFSEEDWLTWANEHMRPATIVLGKTKTQGQQWYSFPVAGHTQSLHMVKQWDKNSDSGGEIQSSGLHIRRSTRTSSSLLRSGIQALGLRLCEWLPVAPSPNPSPQHFIRNRLS